MHHWQRYEGPEYASDSEAPDRQPAGLVLVSETEEEYFHPVAVQYFFDPPGLRDELYQAVTRPYGQVRRAYLASRPGDQWWRNIGRF